MKCPNCHKEQHNNKFCTNCGVGLSEQDQSSTNTNNLEKDFSAHSPSHETTAQQSPLHNEEKEAVNQKKHNQDNVEEKSKESNDSRFTKQHIVKTLIYSIAIYVFVLGAAIGSARLFRNSMLMKDFTYRMFTTVLHMNEDVAIRMASQAKISFWNVLVVMHGGSIEGAVKETIVDSNTHILSDFSLHLPIILATVILFFFLIFLFKGVKKVLPMNMKHRVWSLLLSTFLYTVFILATLSIFNPTVSQDSLSFTLDVGVIQIVITTSIIYVLAGLIGFGPWDTKEEGAYPWLTIVEPFKKFIIVLLSLELLITIMMVVVWNMTSPAVLFSKPLSTPATMWYEYRSEPLFYLLLPNLVLTELLYAIGGTWQVTSPLLGKLIQLDQLMTFNIVTGVDLLSSGEVSNDWLDEVVGAVRFVWHPYAMFIAFLYALANSDIKGDLKGTLTKFIGVCVIVFLLAQWVTVSLTNHMNQTTEVLGFEPLQVVISAACIAGAYYGLAYLIRKLFNSKAVGDTDV